MNQGIGEIYSFAEQQFIMSIVLDSSPEEIIDVAALKEKVHGYAEKLQEDKDMNGNFDELSAALKSEVMTVDEVKKAAIEKRQKLKPKSNVQLRRPKTRRPQKQTHKPNLTQKTQQKRRSPNETPTRD